MGRKRMAKCVGGYTLGQPNPLRRLMDRLLNHGFVQMVPCRMPAFRSSGGMPLQYAGCSAG